MRKLLLIIGLIFLGQGFWAATALAAGPPPSENAVSGGVYHWVQYGETLSSIGRWYGVNAYTICSANNLYNCNYIYAGQRLWIPTGYEGHYGYGCSVTHQVQYGETLSGIAQWYGVTTWTLAERNNIYNLNRVYAGQVLCIRY